jgi:hypothetical protein
VFKACVGTPTDLKHQYDCGYELLVRLEPPAVSVARLFIKDLVFMRCAVRLRILSCLLDKSLFCLLTRVGDGNPLRGNQNEGDSIRQRLRKLDDFVLQSIPGSIVFPNHPGEM